MLRLMLSFIHGMLVKDEKGQGMVEYGLIIALIAVVVIAALLILGPQINDLFTDVGTHL